MDDYDLIKNAKYWSKLSEQISKEISDLKSENKRLLELLKKYQYRESVFDPFSKYCNACGKHKDSGCRLNCEIKKVLE